MKLTNWIFVFLLSICTINAMAQDTIKLKDSAELKVKIVEVTPTKIFYKVIDSPNAYTFVLSRSRVEKIIYENGTVEEVDNDSRFHRHLRSLVYLHKKTYGKNIISFAFLQAGEDSHNEGGDGGGPDLPGLGLHYERMLNDKGTLSFYLPLATYYYSVFTPGSGAIREQPGYSFFYIYPGVKFYPWGSTHVLNYSIGSSIAIGFGDKREYGYNSLDNSYEVHSRDVLKTGLMLNNGLNIMCGRHICIGAEIGLGFTFYDNDFTGSDFAHDRNTNHAVTGIFQFNNKIGYRF
ncbi:MAG TPA: hypothetical protein VK705_10405 [Ferruginibacter sp.]|jgi:hypothetical protein|nr:hypothetical protein [Ferruginibacter sp.]